VIAENLRSRSVATRAHAALHRDQRGNGRARSAQPLAIYTYLIEHDEGLILLDSGESARTSARGWFPWWNPFFQLAVDIHVEPEDEIGPRLRSTPVSSCAKPVTSRPRCRTAQRPAVQVHGGW
jgi:hypothetical protein